MLYIDLSKLVATTITNDLKTNNIAPTSAMTAYLAILDQRVGCWKGIFAAISTWLDETNPEEAACAWQSIIKVCNQDGRPLAAYSRLYTLQNNVEALKTMWLAMPPNTLMDLQVALACNPLMMAAFNDSTSGITGLPAVLQDPIMATNTWNKMLATMTKLSLYENPTSI